MLAFRGAGGEPPQAAPCGVSPFPLIPQESRTFHSNQPVLTMDLLMETIQKKTIF